VARLCGDEHNTVGAAGTVDSSGRGILHYVDALNIVDVYVLKGVLHLEAVDNVEGLSALSNRRTTAHGDVDVGTRRTALLYNLHTGSLTGEGLGSSGYWRRGQFLGSHGNR